MAIDTVWDLAAARSAERHFLMEVTALGLTPGTFETFYFSTNGFTTEPTDTPPNRHYAARIQTPPTFEWSLFEGGRLSGRSVPGFGSISLINADGGLDHLRARKFQGRNIKIYIGAAHWTRSQYSLFFDGTVLNVEATEDSLKFILRDHQYSLDKDITTPVYPGTGWPGGGPELKDQPYPRLIGGAFHYLEPEYMGVDASGRRTYRVCPGPWGGAWTVLDRGVGLDYVPATPAAGQYSNASDEGYLLVGGEPVGPLVIGCQGDLIMPATNNSTITLAHNTAIGIYINQPYQDYAIGEWVWVRHTASPNVAKFLMKITGRGHDGVGNYISGMMQVWYGTGTYTGWTVYSYGTIAKVYRHIATLANPSVQIDVEAYRILNELFVDPIGMYLPDGGNALQIMDEIAERTGTWYGFTRQGLLTMGFLTPPVPASSIGTINDHQIIRLGAPSHEEPFFRFDINHAENPRPHSLGELAGSVTEATKLALMRKNYHHYLVTNAVQTDYPLAGKLKIESLHRHGEGAIALANKLKESFGVSRDIFEVTIKAWPGLFTLGSNVGLESERFGLMPGRVFRMIKIVDDFEANEVTVTLWG